MANELQPLSVLFQNRLFRIPDYQRGYAWQQPQLMDFWDDLLNLQEGRYHYTGLLSLKILERRETEAWGSDTWMLDKGFKPCHIVDGQQRLTTIAILLNEIIRFVRSLEGNAGKTDDEVVIGFDTLKDVTAKYLCQRRPPNNQITTYLFGYEVDDPSDDYLRFCIFHEKYPGTVKETYYTKNLKYAQSFFHENLSALYKEEGEEGLNSLYQKLTLKVLFQIHEIEDDYNVFVAFETMNNRGKRLTNLELLKNRLIYLTTLFPEGKADGLEKSNLRKQINDAWKEVYYQLGRNEGALLSDDEFLRAHWIVYFMYSRKKGNDYINFLLGKFSAKNIYEKKTVALDGMGQEEPGRLEYDMDEEPDGDGEEPKDAPVLKLEPGEVLNYVSSLKEMAKYWYATFFPMQCGILTSEEAVWVDRLNRIGIGYFRPLVTAVISRRDVQPKERVEAFQAMERFIFICFRVGYFNASFCSSEYYRAARKVYWKEMGLRELVDGIKKNTDDNVEYAVPNFVTKIEKHFRNMHGFYYWNSIKYFLYEYESHLAKENNINKVSWEAFTRREKDKVTVEHILPQAPVKYYWRNQFRQFSEQETALLSCALGNLLPLSQSINSALQNDSFEEKKASKPAGRRGYQNGSHSEIEVAKEKNWTAKKIYLRSKKLLRFMETRWQFRFSKKQMEKLVYVSFAIDRREPVPELPKEEK